MHTTNLDLSLEEITKIEGAAKLDLKIRDGIVTECNFSISEMRRFFEQAVRGKPIVTVPHLVARICGTCSNAHLLCSLKAIENGIGQTPSSQTHLLRQLLNFGLLIRDHGLHLYVFALPDLFGKDSILDFDENDPKEHQLLDDCFAVKNAGNLLGITVGGRSVHAPLPRLGGFSALPKKDDLDKLIPILEEIRPRVIHLIEVFLNCPFQLKQNLKFLALTDPTFSFLSGTVKTSDGKEIPESEYGNRLERVEIPYSQATGYKFEGNIYFVGALARLNLNRDALHANIKRDAAKALEQFPSSNIFHNNLAQAIEILHCVDASIDLIHTYKAIQETQPAVVSKDCVGTGVIEAPRGTLFHRYEITADGKIKKAKVIVPTGQNQIGIERSIKDYVSGNVDKPKEELSHEIEKIIRAYDPCMSCATHFLKIKWK